MSVHPVREPYRLAYLVLTSLCKTVTNLLQHQVQEVDWHVAISLKFLGLPELARHCGREFPILLVF